MSDACNCWRAGLRENGIVLITLYVDWVMEPIPWPQVNGTVMSRVPDTASNASTWWSSQNGLCSVIETTVLDFKLSNTFEQYRDHMNAPEQQVMFAQMGVKTFYIGVCKDDPKRATVMFQGPENVLYEIFVNPETKPVVEASGHVYDGTVITRWLS